MTTLINTRVEVESDHWYTPAWLVDVAVELMGDGVTDPCTCLEAHGTLPAHVRQGLTPIFERDFLHDEYQGGSTVWLNPPYSKACGTAGAFTDRLIELCEAGKVERACVLVNNSTDANWWHNLAGYSAAVCFLSKRVQFERVEADCYPLLDTAGSFNLLRRVKAGAPKYGNVLHYIDRRGPFSSGKTLDVARFLSLTEQHGTTFEGW